MRSYASIAPTFWTRGSGKRLRGDLEAQVVALYLMSSPATTMVGIFHLALPTLCHETGLPLEGALKGLARCSEEGLAYYDEEEELVWVPALAQHQLGDHLGQGKSGKLDHRVTGVKRALAAYKGHRFYDLFLERYGDAYSLFDGAERELRKPLDRGSRARARVPAPAPVLIPDPEGAQGEPEPRASRPKRKASETTLPEPFGLTDKHTAYAAGKGWPEWWLRNRHEDFCGKAIAKGWRYTNWDQALYTFLRGEIAYKRGPDELAHLGPSVASAPELTDEARKRAEALARDRESRGKAALGRLAAKGIKPPERRDLETITGEMP